MSIVLSIKNKIIRGVLVHIIIKFLKIKIKIHQNNNNIQKIFYYHLINIETFQWRFHHLHEHKFLLHSSHQIHRNL